jgi:hypothetical protein
VALQKLWDEGQRFDRVIAIGPMIMMKFVCQLTKQLGVETIVSMNPIMVDGTGMCGACRLMVGGKVKFACVDGPEFDGHEVDFAQAMQRMKLYATEEGRLYLKAKEGYDIVYATRQNRPDTYFMTKGSQAFNSLMGFLTDTQQDKAVAEFAIFSHKVIDAMAQMGDYRRYYPLMTQWVGFKTAKVDVEHAVRTDGKKSSYSIKKRIELAVSTAVSFSTKSLRLIVYFGTLITLLAIIAAIVLVIKTMCMDEEISGWITLFVSMWFIAGILIMIVGIIAVYIGSIFDEVKHRPTYLVSEKLNFEK